MALTYGFYNSINHDRKYDAIQVGQLFDGLIKDGVYETYKKAMIVKESSADNQVIIQPGRAWFDHTWSYNDTDYYLNMPAPEYFLDRIDAVVLDVGTLRDMRRNSFQVVTGTPANNPVRPSLIKEEGHNQYPLCYVRRTHGKNRITQGDITNMVGTSECPFVVGVIEGLVIDDLIAQWQGEFTNWMGDIQEEFTDWMESEQSDFTNWRTTQQSDFTNWRNTQQSDFTNWRTTQQSDFTNWRNTQQSDFTNWMGSEQSSFTNWRNTQQSDFTNWMTNRKNQFTRWMDSVEKEFWNKLETHDKDFISWMESEKNKYSAFLNHNYTAWTNWFTHIQTELDDDVAGHLQQQIDWLKKFASIYVVDKTLFVPMSAASVSGKTLIFAK